MTLRLPKYLLLLILSTILYSRGFAQKSDSVKQEKIKRFLYFPLIQKSIETGWGAGAAGSYFFKTTHRKDSLVRTSNIEALGLYTVKQQFVGVLGFNIYFPDEKYILKWRNTYSHFPDKFWGFGNNTPDSNEENYVFSQIFINPQLIRKVYKDFYVGISYELQKVYNLEYKAGGLFDQENVPGKQGGIVSGAGVVIAWDTRDNAFYCTKGTYAQLMVLDFDSSIGSDFAYVNYVIDFRKFWAVRNKKDVFAVQYFGYLNSGEVAIRNMAILGGSDIMRGYFEGRYTDKNLVAFQGEYRMPLPYGFGLAAFVGYGEVFKYAREFKIRELKYSWGGGIRYALNKTEKLNLRVDYGFGENTSGWYFTVRESF